MKKIYDWIVVGGGITGAALGYELARQGLAVLLLEQQMPLQGASRYGYGGLAFWAANTPLMRILCSEGIERHRELSAELDWDTEFRELDLLMIIPPESDCEEWIRIHQAFEIPPQFLTVEETNTCEPLLAPDCHQGSLVVKHGHIRPTAAVEGFWRSMQRLGGRLSVEKVTQLMHTDAGVTGVKTESNTYSAAQVVICAGGTGRSLLQQVGISLPLYFTHAELIEFPACSWRLQTMVQEVGVKRFDLESKATQPQAAPLWEEPGHEPATAILDPGLVQFRNGSLRLGQISRTLTDPVAYVDPVSSATQMRQAVEKMIPAVAGLTGTWYRCLVAFSGDSLPLIGGSGVPGLQIFSGFSNPLLIVPPLARRYAQTVMGVEDGVISQLDPRRLTL